MDITQATMRGAGSLRSAATELLTISDNHVSALLQSNGGPHGSQTIRSIQSPDSIRHGLRSASIDVLDATDQLGSAHHTHLGVVNARIGEALSSVDHLQARYPGAVSFTWDSAAPAASTYVEGGITRVTVAPEDGIHVRTITDAARSHHELRFMADALGG